jgi:hypothetical protein
MSRESTQDIRRWDAGLRCLATSKYTVGAAVISVDVR